MRTGTEAIESRGLRLTDEGLTVEQLAAVGLPLVVACTGCTTTMALPSALVDDNEYTWCSDCAGEDDSELMEARIG